MRGLPAGGPVKLELLVGLTGGKPEERLRCAICGFCAAAGGGGEGGRRSSSESKVRDRVGNGPFSE